MKTLKASPNNLGVETMDSVDNDGIEEAKHWAISQKQSCAKKFNGNPYPTTRKIFFSIKNSRILKTKYNNIEH